MQIQLANASAAIGAQDAVPGGPAKSSGKDDGGDAFSEALAALMAAVGAAAPANQPAPAPSGDGGVQTAAAAAQGFAAGQMAGDRQTSTAIVAPPSDPTLVEPGDGGVQTAAAAAQGFAAGQPVGDRQTSTAIVAPPNDPTLVESGDGGVQAAVAAVQAFAAGQTAAAQQASTARVVQSNDPAAESSLAPQITADRARPPLQALLDLAKPDQTPPAQAQPGVQARTVQAAAPTQTQSQTQGQGQARPLAPTVALVAATLDAHTPTTAQGLQEVSQTQPIPALNAQASVLALPPATPQLLAKAAPPAMASGKTSETSAADQTAQQPAAPAADRTQAVAPPPQPSDSETSDQHDDRAAAGGQTRGADTTATSNNGADNSAAALQTAGVAAPQAAQSVSLAAQAVAPSVVSQLAGQVVKNVQGKSTRFDVALEPAGLGRVDVRVQIDPQGQVTAQFSFASPHAAAEARTQAGQLQQALEQAGFNVGQGGLSFDVGGQGAGFARQDSPAPQAAAVATAIQTIDTVASLTPAAALAAYALGPSSALDITI